MARLSPEYVIGVVGMVGGMAAGVEVWINAVGSGLLIPSRRVGEAQRVVAAVGIAVEGLGAGGILHVGVHREESTGQRVVAAAVHVDEAEARDVLMTCIATVTHGLSRRATAPCFWIPQVTPGIVAQLLLHVAFAVNYRRPAAEVVLQDVVDGFLVVPLFHHGEDAKRSGKVGASLRGDGVAVVFGEVLAHAHVVLVPYRAAHGIRHADALPVVAVGVFQTVATFMDGLHLVETSVGDGLACGGEHIRCGLSALHGMGTGWLALCSREVGIGENGLPVSLLGGHSSQRVVADLAVRAAKVYVGQAVHVLTEGFLKKSCQFKQIESISLDNDCVVLQDRNSLRQYALI